MTTRAELKILHDGRYSPLILAEILGVATQTLADWRHKGMGPEYIKIGKAVFYLDAAIDQWYGENARRSTSEKPRPRRSNERPNL